MSRDTFSSPKAPAAIGPYSQGIRSKSGLVFMSGQTPIDPTTGELVPGAITEQTQQVFKNLAAVLEVVLHRVFDRQDFWCALHDGQVDDCEAGLKLREFVKLIQHQFRQRAAFEFNHDSHGLCAVGLVAQG